MTTRCLTLAILILVASAALAARTASAQSPIAPRVELGGTFSAILPVVAADGPVFLVGGGPRLGVNLTRTIGLQGSLEMLGPFADRNGINGVYGADARFAVRHGQNGQRTLSITVGLAGGFQYLRRSERRVTRPDGSIVVTPAHRRLRTSNPATVVLGLTGDHVFSRRGALSTAIQVFVGQLSGMAIRGSVGVSFGAGGYR
jgi:hypothetical protein